MNKLLVTALVIAVLNSQSIMAFDPLETIESGVKSVQSGVEQIGKQIGSQVQGAINKAKNLAHSVAQTVQREARTVAQTAESEAKNYAQSALSTAKDAQQAAMATAHHLSKGDLKGALAQASKSKDLLRQATKLAPQYRALHLEAAELHNTTKALPIKKATQAYIR